VGTCCLTAPNRHHTVRAKETTVALSILASLQDTIRITVLDYGVHRGSRPSDVDMVRRVPTLFSHV
jgi:hypothetical protein